MQFGLPGQKGASRRSRAVLGVLLVGFLVWIGGGVPDFGSDEGETQVGTSGRPLASVTATSPAWEGNAP